MELYKEKTDYKDFYRWFGDILTKFMTKDGITLFGRLRPLNPNEENPRTKTLQYLAWVMEHQGQKMRTTRNRSKEVWVPWGIVISELLEQQCKLKDHRYVKPPVIEEALHYAITWSTMQFFLCGEKTQIRPLLNHYYHRVMDNLHYELPYNRYSGASYQVKPKDLVVMPPLVIGDYYDCHKVLTTPLHPPPGPTAGASGEQTSENGHTERTADTPDTETL